MLYISTWITFFKWNKLSDNINPIFRTLTTKYINMSIMDNPSFYMVDEQGNTDIFFKKS